ncbi:MAG: hypothetical protein KG075_09495 [Alphaproteobacteria bacterium]|nr:hypothetical protein [Alphaproteobacteria bacterium]
MGAIAKAITSVFTGPQAAPSPTPAPLPPVNDPAAQEAAQRAAEEERRRVMSGGRAANVLTSPLGDTSQDAQSARKLLLGGG